MKIRLANQGSVDDIRCSVKYSTHSKSEYQDEINFEKAHQNRSTVIKMIEAKIKKLEKK